MHAWLVIIHVHVHVADDVLHDFIKLTKVNTERRPNAALMQVHRDRSWPASTIHSPPVHPGDAGILKRIEI